MKSIIGFKNFSSFSKPGNVAVAVSASLHYKGNIISRVYSFLDSWLAKWMEKNEKKIELVSYVLGNIFRFFFFFNFLQSTSF